MGPAAALFSLRNSILWLQTEMPCSRAHQLCEIPGCVQAFQDSWRKLFKQDKNMQFKPIGKIYTPYKTKKDCPIQPIYASNAEGTIKIFEQYANGLKDIEAFSHFYILYLFDRAGEIQLIRPTFLDDEPHGIYASRHPCRPNYIGMSIVQLKERAGNTLIVNGVDVLDDTPLLDIKPYIPKFDTIESASNGWVDGAQWRPKPRNCE
jgi:tRNA-Thr(GGU) m(6)t(6)A37 methyltransferase TsaA